MFKFKMPGGRQTALWGLALPGLIALNLMRDVSISKLTYRWSPVTRQTFHIALTVPGTFEADAALNIKAAYDGEISAVPVKTGDVVRFGQKLISFSSTAASLDLQSKTAKCKTIETNLRKARKRLETQKKLWKVAAISRSYINDTIRIIESLKDKWSVAEAERVATLKKWKALSVRSPLANATVLAVSARPGAVVMSGEPLITLSDNTKLLLRVKIDAENVRKISLGQTALITSQDGKTQGKVKAIGAQGMVSIEILDAQFTASHPNGAAQATLQLEDIPDAMAVPKQAVTNQDDHRGIVMVRTKRGWTRPRKVLLGRASDKYIQVLGGLEDGDWIGALSTDITAAGVDATDDGGESISIDSSSFSKKRSSRDQSLTNKP
jgi:RND family efflux transporter MFP subunit